MKNLFTLILTILIAVSTFAQIPDKMSYQAVIRNSSDQLMVNQQIGMQISILQDAEDGTSVYTETQTPTTNSNGLVTVEFGGEAGWNAIDWSSGVFFIKTEIAPDGSSNYTITGTSKLLSVPYAIYAKDAGSINSMPSVFTNTVSDITVTGASCGGNVVTNGGSEITARGVCWSTGQNPEISDSVTIDGTGTGYYNSEITEVDAGITYYVRAYATNSKGTSYGNQEILEIPSNVVFPTVTTTAVTNITANAATSGGTVTETGGAEVTERGVCWSENQNPTVSNSKTVDGEGDGQFQSQVAGLLPGTYYLRAYATNSTGTGYGNTESFTTEKTLPVLTTKNINNISAMGAVSGGVITTDGGGTISERGICWSEAPNPTITSEKTSSGSTSASFSVAIAKAAPNTTYYLKAYATNELGTGYGEEKSFTTSEAHYYTSFETGMTPAGWSGPFTVTTEVAFDGSYSFMSLYGQDNEEEFTTTLDNDGQISFYYSFYGSAISISFYIDDVLTATFPNDASGWRQGMVSVSAGTHTLKWHYTDNSNSFKGKCYIDQITITK